MSLKSLGGKLAQIAEAMERTEMDDVWDAIRHLSSELKDIKSRLEIAGAAERAPAGSDLKEEHLMARMREFDEDNCAS